MDILKTAQEIGQFELARNLSEVCDSAEVAQRVGAVMPLPAAGIDGRIKRICRWLLDSGKQKFMLLTPEIALADGIAGLSEGCAEVMIAVPCNMEQDAKGRLGSNLPRGLKAVILEEPYFPDAFFPANGMLAVCGYLAGNRAMVLPETYRMAEHYSGFHGKKVFLPYVELDGAARYPNWMELSQQNLDTIWRDGQ